MDVFSAMEILGAGGLGASVLGFILFTYWRRRERGCSVLQKWAEENRLQILSSQERYLFGVGPFLWWNVVAKQPVYYVKVREEGGKVRSGWVRVECKWGFLEEGDRKTEARWES